MASPKILVLNSWTDSIMESSFSFAGDGLERDPSCEGCDSDLTSFLLRPMLAFSVRRLIGLGFGWEDSSVDG